MATKLPGPGLYRAGLFSLIGLAFSYALTIGSRAAMHYEPVLDGTAICTVALIAVPFFFLVGLGAFDYWFYWAAGRPTRPEDHSSHGAHSWRDYFRVNTDHKVIGIQYTVTSFFFLLVGGLIAMLIRAELAQPGSQFVDANAYNGLFSVHASLLIFLFIIPVFAGLANFVLPLMIGAPDMAFPRLNALSYWMLPVAGVMMLASFFAPGGSFNTGWTAYAPLSTEAPIGQLFFTVGVQFAGASQLFPDLSNAPVSDPHVCQTVEACRRVEDVGAADYEIGGACVVAVHAATSWAAPVARARIAERTEVPAATCDGIREEPSRTTSPEISTPLLTGPGCMTRTPPSRCRRATP